MNTGAIGTNYDSISSIYRLDAAKRSTTGVDWVAWQKIPTTMIGISLDSKVGGLLDVEL
jgi:hypothetical protein